MNASWIRKNLKNESPKLILTPKLEKQLKAGIKNNELVKTYYAYLRQYADTICTQPLLERKKTGRRLLSVSREAVQRISTLAIVYRLEKDDRYLNRLTREIDTVCRFSGRGAELSTTVCVWENCPVRIEAQLGEQREVVTKVLGQ